MSFLDSEWFTPTSIVIGIVASLVVIKRYFGGARCHVEANLEGKIAVVTGGNTGLGFQVSKKMCELGCKVIIGARDVKKSQTAVQELKKISKAGVVAYHLDLSKKRSIQQFANNVKKQLGEQSLDYLINNAGTIALPQRTLTQLGLQMQIGVNFFGHFYLTYLLWPALKKNPHPRIMHTTSSACDIKPNLKNASIDFANLNYENGGYNRLLAYCRSKKANVLFCKQLQRRMDQAKIPGLSICAHPGSVRTEAKRQIVSTLPRKILYYIFAHPFMLILSKSPWEGAQTLLYTILEREDKLVKGGYYAQCKNQGLRAHDCNSPQYAERIWAIAEGVFGIKFQV